MRQVALLAISCLGMAVYVLGQRPGNTKEVTPAVSYELYSWQESNGKWSFCVLASPSGMNVSAEQVFNKRFLLAGVGELKRKISRLPAGATIYWLDHIVGTSETAKEGARLSYPPSEIIQEVRRYAETRKIKVEMLSGQQGKL